MSAAMEWSHDFCLSCDRQITDGAYCSQACRLADLEKASSGSEPNSPHCLSSSATSTASYSSNTSTASAGFRLPPALNFAAYKPASSSRQDYASASHVSSHYSSYFSQQSPTYAYSSHSEESERPQRALSPSSSRSSLSSITNCQTSQGMSPQAATALRGYVSSFDQVRDTKRRLHRQA